MLTFRFTLLNPGHDASLSLPDLVRSPLFLEDVRDLLMYAMVGDRTPKYPLG